jgi:hypothetical protein
MSDNVITCAYITVAFLYPSILWRCISCSVREYLREKIWIMETDSDKRRTSCTQRLTSYFVVFAKYGRQIKRDKLIGARKNRDMQTEFRTKILHGWDHYDELGIAGRLINYGQNKSCKTWLGFNACGFKWISVDLWVSQWTFGLHKWRWILFN